MSAQNSDNDPVKIGEELLRAERFEELAEFCQDALERDGGNVLLWKLAGVAHGNLGNHEGARFHFLCAIKLDPSDAGSLANYAMACIEAGDKVAAADGVRKLLPALDYDGQKHVVETMMHAVADQLITVDDLPPVVVDLMNSLGTP